MKIAILGAGNVALANAVWLSRAGHDVHIWSALETERRHLQAAGEIAYEGFISGTAAVTAAETAESAIKGAGMVMIAAPAFGHEALMSAAAPHLIDDQDVVIHPVTGLSSLILSAKMKERNVRPTIVDLSTSLFTTRKQGPTTVKIMRIKDLIDVATIPTSRGAAAKKRLDALYGERFRLDSNVLAISLNNHNPIYHVPPLLCNLSRAEKVEGWIIWECITPGVAKFVKLADDERLKIVDYFGTTRVPVDQYFRQSFGVDGANLDEIFAAVARKLKGPIGPQAFDHRFFTEDVPYALVFYRSLGKLADIEMPITESLITIVSGLFAKDFTAEGHTLERLGLGGRSRDEIIQITCEGF